MGYRQTLAAVVSLVLLSIPVAAQPPRQPLVEPVLIAPSELQTIDFAASFFTDDTLAVADIDVAAVDAAAAFGWLLPRLERGPIPQQQELMLQQLAVGTIQTLRNAGVQHIYITVAARDLIQGGVSVLVPCDQTATVGNLLEMMVPQLPKSAQYQVKSQPGYVVLSPQRTWERIKGRPAADRQGLLDAIHRVDHLPHRIAVQLPEAIRREVAAIWPESLPSVSPVQLSPSALAADMRAIAVGFRLPPNPQIETHLVAPDDAAAGRIDAQLQGLLQMIPEAVGRPVHEVVEHAVVVQFSGQWFEGALAQLTGPMRQAGARQRTINNLKQIGLAIHNYHDTYRTLPPRATVTADGQPLLSWRVHLLPYLDQQPLYDQFRLDEPWNSPHNLALIPQMPEVFRVPGDALAPSVTRIRLPQIAGSTWAGNDPPRTFSQLTDGSSNTIAAAVAPVEAAITWTQPEPWQLDEAKLVESFFGGAESTPVLWFDASVRPLPSTIDPETLRALLTHAGGEKISMPQ